MLFFTGACAASQAPQTRIAATKATGTPAVDPASLESGVLLRESSSGLKLPVWLRPQTLEERQFGVAAGRALRLVYDEDHDDASMLLALADRLDTQAALAQVREIWGPILGLGIARAHVLEHYAPGLRALRQAYEEVYIDTASGALKKLSGRFCRTAVSELSLLTEAYPQLVITVEPLGPALLTQHLAPCRPL